MQKDFDTELAAVRPRVLALARKFIRASGLRTDAEDIVQEVLLRLWTALNGGAEVLNAEAWASRVTHTASALVPRKGSCPLVVRVPLKNPIFFARSYRSFSLYAPSLHRVGSPPSKSTNREPMA